MGESSGNDYALTSMELLLIGEYIRRTPTAVSAWVPDLARGLAARGHTITLAIDGTDDPAIFDGMRTLVHRPMRHHLGADPFSFRAWAAGLRGRGGPIADAAINAVLSLTPLVPGDVWLPLGPRAKDTVRALVRTLKPLSAAMELVHVPWLPANALAERLAMDEARRQNSRELTIGPVPTHAGVVPLGYASRLEQPTAQAEAAIRARVREFLGINPHRPVIAASLLHAERGGMDAFFRGVSQVRQERTHGLPLVLVLGRAGASVERSARSAGCLEAVRFLGQTHLIADILTASDLAASPLSGDPRAATGRFIADALRIGKPVIAVRGSPGAELLSMSAPGTQLSPGWIVDKPDAGAWVLGLNTALSKEWLERRTPVARTIGAGLAMPALLDRLEQALREAAHRRAIA